MLLLQVPSGCPSSLLKELYDPRAFIAHAGLLDQAFAHCPIFLTAASRGSLDRVSVPVWLIILSDQLSIVALVGHYPTNKLMDRNPIPSRLTALPEKTYVLTRSFGISSGSRSYPQRGGTLATCYAPVRHFTRPPKGTFSFDLHV